MAGFNNPVLPAEIWREILARLPVKSVLRCTSVCKSWYSLVSCPDFISHHSITNLHNKNGNRFLLQLIEDESRVSSFSSHDESCMESREHDDDCLEILMRRNLGIIGSCNGLICLLYFSPVTWTATFLIWNPAIRKIVELPSSNSWRHSQVVSFVGFGFDSNASDYKVMCNLRDYDTETDDYEIIDLNKGVWRSISPLLPSQIFRDEAECCYANGAAHWSVCRNVEGFDWVILSFNMSDESFREISMPDRAEFTQRDDDYDTETRCVTFGGLVHVIMWKSKEDGYEEILKGCSIWAMKEYGAAESWIQVSNIDPQSGQVLPRVGLCPKRFILWVANCEILMVHYPLVDDDNQDLVLYNTGTGKTKHVFTVTKRFRHLCQYKESLALM